MFSYRVSLAGLLNVVSGDDDRSAVVGTQTHQVIPDTVNQTDKRRMNKKLNNNKLNNNQESPYNKHDNKKRNGEKRKERRGVGMRREKRIEEKR